LPAIRADADDRPFTARLRVTVIVLKDMGHWPLEEQPAETISALSRFL
jgi:pimeloyl-ACP methyl ester carboxylesterase